MSWIQEYLDYQDSVKRETMLHKFMMTMYPTGWHHYGYKTVREWATQGLKSLGL